jgi:spore maturation protein SpmA
MLMEVGETPIALKTVDHVRSVFPQTNEAGAFKITRMTVNTFWIVLTVFC